MDGFLPDESEKRKIKSAAKKVEADLGNAITIPKRVLAADVSID